MSRASRLVTDLAWRIVAGAKIKPQTPGYVTDDVRVGVSEQFLQRQGRIAA